MCRAECSESEIVRENLPHLCKKSKVEIINLPENFPFFANTGSK